LIQAAFSIIPHLLGVQIMIQNTLLAQYYTVLHNYCEDTGFPSPAPPMTDVISTWEEDFNPIKNQVERIGCVARGKVIHQSMTLGDDPGRRTASSSTTGLNVRNGFQRRTPSIGRISAPPSPQPEPADAPRGRPMRISSNQIVPVFAPPAASATPSPEPYSTHLTPASTYSSHSTANSSIEYFQRSAAGKKKPPPPPPKRIGSQSNGLFATALYAFEGQSAGDLSFNEGDQIKVLKKTDSTDDWWEGELRGKKGSFPANYCKL
jgi:amphiphysin